MSNPYRINTRFNRDIPDQDEAVRYLQSMNEQGHRQCNNFIVQAVIDAIKREKENFEFSLEDIREVIHDELGRCCFIMKDDSLQYAPFTPDDDHMSQDEKDAAILEGLEVFGC